MILGRTGLKVTELCFGALPIGPLQKNVDPNEAAEVIALALSGGVNFIDTAQMYHSQTYVRHAMELSGKKPVISTKSHMTTYDDMRAAIEQSREELGMNVLDIYLIHAARANTNVLKERAGAYRCLMEYREKGFIKAIGIACHDVAVIEMAATEKELDVVFPIHNKIGMGILGGTLAEMEAAIELCFVNNKGLYLMKALAGGNLISDYDSAMSYSRNFSKGRAPIVLGMVNKQEVEMNLKYFNDENIADKLEALKTTPDKKVFVVPPLCKFCGKCKAACHSDAIEESNGKAVVIDERCLKCGYCVSSCPEFAIRMI